MILEGNFTNACDSVLFSQVRQKFDEEIAGAKKYSHESLEDYADMICLAARSDTAKCKAILESGKTIEQAYQHIEEEARKRVKDTKYASMGGREALKISLKFFGADDPGTEATEATPQPQKKEEGVKSLFDMI